MKRILIISANPITDSSNNGKTMKAMFSNFKRENLAQLYFSQGEVPNYDVCCSYYHYTDSDLLRDRVSFHKNSFDQRKDVSDNTLSHTNPIKGFSILKTIFTSIPFLRSIFWYKAEFNSRIENWAKLFNPDIIFVYCGNESKVFNFAIHLANLNKVPIIPFFSDDYAFSPRGGLVTFIQRRIILSKCKSILKLSPFGFAIGQDMCSFYESQFKKKFYKFVNAVDFDNSLVIEKESCISSDKINITFIGGLTIGRDKALLEFSRIIKLAKLRQKIDINIYTTTKLETKLKKHLEANGVIIHKPVYGQELQEARNSADMMLHLESPKLKYYSYAKYSVSTKISEYLSSGKLTICYGPSVVSSVKMFIESDLGIVVDSLMSKQDQIKTVADCFSDLQKYVNVPFRAYNYAKANYDKKINADKFISVLNSI